MIEGIVHLEPHVCRHCLSRVVSRDGEFFCSGCGVTCNGKPHGICGCGASINGVRKRAAPFRCGLNPNRGPRSPANFVVLFEGIPAILTPLT